MKSSLITVASMALLIIMAQACNRSGKDHMQTEHHHEEHAEGETHDHESPAEDMLTLNNGAKWQADEPTNRNAGVINSIGENFLKNNNRTLETYNALGTDISQAINTMIRECTMKGEADQALHYWFAPMLQRAGTLKNATDTTGLSDITSEMIERMRMYQDYFE